MVKDAPVRGDRVTRATPHAVRRPKGWHAGLGGALRTQPEDFRVEEIPLARAAGSGQFTLACIQKRGTTTFDALLFLSKAAKVSERQIGYAGLKDSRAVTTQHVTLPKVAPERLRGLVTPRWRVLSAHRHDAPLKIGHHRGNRFTIRIRGMDATRIGAAQHVLEAIHRRGLPNAYGAQRFGTRWDGHLVGRALLDRNWPEFLALVLGRPSALEHSGRVREARAHFDAGDVNAAHRAMPLRHRVEKRLLGHLARGGGVDDTLLEVLPRPQSRMWVSAWQSYLFNCILDARIAADTFDQVLPGDLVQDPTTGALWLAGPEDRGRGVPTGPLRGASMRAPAGVVGAAEAAIFAQEDGDPADYGQPHIRSRGGRRPLTVPVHEPSLEQTGPDEALVRFVLPPGAFATVLLDLLMADEERPAG